MIKVFTIIIATFVSTMVLAKSANLEPEINHLLQYVATTDCLYERNGTAHKGTEAKQHIKKKYDYYEDDIETTEDFIKYAATKSTMSGDYYYIQCPGQAKVKSKDWLLAELASFRDK
ncbi:DUF5329 domain-containing protein [Thalassotalea sp. HSM 43]|uniref:DUF5329 family protein n=1 Tax=Thalassotalea sp. HSM 43 TaxID=2552945 RepID=UPI001E54DF97|nr:DUF5329 domain-containing protein [Thalassotalea sp. HSM 43]